LSEAVPEHKCYRVVTRLKDKDLALYEMLPFSGLSSCS